MPCAGLMEMLKTGLGGRSLDASTTCFHAIFGSERVFGRLASAWACPGIPLCSVCQNPRFPRCRTEKKAQGRFLRNG